VKGKPVWFHPKTMFRSKVLAKKFFDARVPKRIPRPFVRHELYLKLQSELAEEKAFAEARIKNLTDLYFKLEQDKASSDLDYLELSAEFGAYRRKYGPK
jgi:hypothetical protein